MSHAIELRLLAQEYEEIGDYLGALTLYRRALIMQEREHPEQSTELVPYIYDLAMINAALDNNTEAKNLFDWALELVPADDTLVPEINMILQQIREGVNAA